ncbi:hypothetical protein BVRB_4g095010 [Beta vulgaris subsp. vulgaris]|uniref:Uncharacterized protein n=1 Tax=Beta vulgaris subsp. vulgaris TaxID=3555 RepID=A0A0J8BDM1_BETVV|nr:hypothetical protein BVRB_4g095010 [Beta vulgaris subsp. vulgaris]
MSSLIKLKPTPSLTNHSSPFLHFLSISILPISVTSVSLSSKPISSRSSDAATTGATFVGCSLSPIFSLLCSVRVLIVSHRTLVHVAGFVFLLLCVGAAANCDYRRDAVHHYSFLFFSPLLRGCCCHELLLVLP